MTTDAILFSWKTKQNKGLSMLRPKTILMSLIPLSTKNLRYLRKIEPIVQPNLALSFNSLIKLILESSKAHMELTQVQAIWSTLIQIERVTKKSWQLWKLRNGLMRIQELFKFYGRFVLLGVRHSLRSKLVSNSLDMAWSQITFSANRVFSFTKTLILIEQSWLFTHSSFSIAFYTLLRFCSNFNLESVELRIS